MNDHHEPSTQILMQAAIRPTRQRTQLAKLLFGNPAHRHFTAESLFDESQRAGFAISQATIYNTLNLFCHSGLIREIAMEGQQNFYDTNTETHPHFYHEETRDIVDAEIEHVEVAYHGELPEDTEMTGIDVVVRVRNQQKQ